MLAVLEKYRKIDTLGNPKSFLLGIASGIPGIPSGKLTIKIQTSQSLPAHRRPATGDRKAGSRLQGRQSI
jgi:hypothetical protein